MILGGLPKPLAEMSDRELEEELQRRRRLRAARRSAEAPITEADRAALAAFERRAMGAEARSDMAAALERVELLKHYAALELRPGASLAQVEQAYRDMLARYGPDRHARDPEKHRLATQLAARLTHSYEVLRRALSGES